MSQSKSSEPTGQQNPDSRRAFLTKTAALAGASIFFGSKTYAARRMPVPLARAGAPLGPNDPIRMAVIGTGGMGTGHCHSILDLVEKKLCNVQIVALADVCQPRLEEARKHCADKQHMTVDTYTDYRDLLKRDDIHGVLIASPEHWHAQHAIDSILAGKDVYLEKPMTFTLDDALRVYEVCNKNPKVIFQVGTQKMQLPKYQEARKVIESGLIGKPTISQCSYHRNNKKGEWLYYGIDKAWEPGKNIDWEQWCKPVEQIPWSPEVYARWRRYSKWSSGIIGDLLVHEMTPMMMATDMGWPTRVHASGAHLYDKAMDNPDTVLLTVEFEKEHLMLVTGATNNEIGLETLIRGNKGNIYLNSRHCVVKPERIYSEEIEEKTIECPDIGNDQDKHRLGWFESIRSREAPLATVDLGTKVMVVVDLATRSMWDGHAYTFDPKTMTATRV
jgi:predicted dehydrogenase